MTKCLLLFFNSKFTYSIFHKPAEFPASQKKLTCTELFTFTEPCWRHHVLCSTHISSGEEFSHVLSQILAIFEACAKLKFVSLFLSFFLSILFKISNGFMVNTERLTYVFGKVTVTVCLTHIPIFFGTEWKAPHRVKNFLRSIKSKSSQQSKMRVVYLCDSRSEPSQLKTWAEESIRIWDFPQVVKSKYGLLPWKR